MLRQFLFRVGELFPLETRAISISLVYAFGTLLGGVAGPARVGALIDTGARSQILTGYLLGGGLMLAAAATELKLGVNAERQPLEEVAAPLSLADQATPTQAAPPEPACQIGEEGVRA